MRALRVLHVIDRLGAGGPARSLIGFAATGARLGLALDHRLACLAPGAYPPLRIDAHRAGIAARVLPDPAWLAESVGWADVVLAHYWNTPAMTAFVEGYDGAPRLALWLKILGRHPPQVAAAPVLARADAVVATSPATLADPALAAPELAGRTAWVPAIVDAARLAGFARRPHDGFVVATVGTLNAGKIHPGFLRMSAAARLPDGRFVVCGDGDAPWRAEAARLGIAGRVAFRGFVEDIRAVLEGADVLGHPLAPDAYATSDRSLQEAMLCGIPPVIFGHGGIAWMVEPERTGLVVDSEAGYAAALERLHADAPLRARLGAAAARHAAAAFDPAAATRRLADMLRHAAAAPARRAPPARDAAPFAAARRFARALGPHGAAFHASLDAATPAQAAAADAAIVALPAAFAQVEGGLFHWRKSCPEDGFLRLWAGLALLGAGRPEAAGAELEAAVACGCAAARAASWLARARDDKARPAAV